MPRFRDRTTADLLVLMIAGTICTVVLVGGGALIISSFASDAEHPAAIALVGDTVAMLTSLLAGFLAGRSEGVMDKRMYKPPPERKPRE